MSARANSRGAQVRDVRIERLAVRFFQRGQVPVGERLLVPAAR